MLVAKLPGSIYATLAIKAGPRNGMSRASPLFLLLPVKTSVADRTVRLSFSITGLTLFCFIHFLFLLQLFSHDQFSNHARLHMSWHSAQDLVCARLFRRGKNHCFRIAWLQTHSPEYITFICLIEHFTCVCAIFHYDEVMLHRAIMCNVKSNFLSCCDGELIRSKGKISHCETDLLS